MRIEPLSPAYADTLASWHFKEWGLFYPGESEQSFRQDLLDCLGDQCVPKCWLALDEQGVWASACIVEDDMSSHPELGPWLANVFVHPDKRGRGLARQLVQAVMDHALERGQTPLYLFTPDQQGLYQKMGWSPWKREAYQGKLVDIMRFN